jgi:hypothetical protein
VLAEVGLTVVNSLLGLEVVLQGCLEPLGLAQPLDLVPAQVGQVELPGQVMGLLGLYYYNGNDSGHADDSDSHWIGSIPFEQLL